MLVLKIEVWPGGDKSRAKQVGYAEISNQSGLSEWSDYLVHAANEHGDTQDIVAAEHYRGWGCWRLVSDVCARLAAKWKYKPLTTVDKAYGNFD